MEAQALTIGKVAQAAGVGVETVRFYERLGLVNDPPRTASGYRQYPLETIPRLQFIRRAKNLGFTLDEIGDLLQLRIGGEAPCEQVRDLATNKLLDIEQRVADLQRMADVLRVLVTACDDGGGSTACPILASLTEPTHTDEHSHES